MPARSQAQRAFLNARFGHAWVKQHGFDNKGRLPMHVSRRHNRRKHLAPTVHALGQRRKTAARNAKLTIARHLLGVGR